MKKNLQQIVKKYLAGEATEEEKKLLSSWYDDFDEDPGPELQEKQWQDTGNEIFQRIQTSKTPQEKTLFRPLRWLRIAAIWFMIIGTTSFLYTQRNWILDQIDPIQQTERQAAKGTVIKLHLPDGTVVWLNGGSTIRFPERFSRSNTREVKLSGEAFFDVAHNKQKPFIVYTGNVKTQVLGTSFNISSYSQLEEVKISVIRGKVAVSAIVQQNVASSATIKLTPNQQAIYNKKTTTLVKEKADANGTTQWIKGGYEFRDATMTEIALALENRFNIKIRITNDSLAKKKITAQFDHTESLHKILDAFKQTANLKYTFVTATEIKWN